ncbi:hypothetical protein [Microbacterium sp. E-13]|uniref:hypothetical protein n=1 Tax=Microbacterium sp. E-13 TaxID=3404048 RepID=UPI003CE7E937
MLNTSARAESADDARAKRGVSRRQLVKAGAWAAPAIVMTTAAPAHAASGPAPVAELQLGFESPSLFYAWGANSADGIGGKLKVTLAATTGAGSSGAITVQVALDAAGLSTAAPTVSGAGWSSSAGEAGSGANAGKTIYTFTYAPGLTAPQTSSELAFVIAKAATGFTPTTSRPWSATAVATSTATTTIKGASTLSSVALGAPGFSAIVAGAPTIVYSSANNNSNKKIATVTVPGTSNAAVVVRLTITSKHKDDNFTGSFPTPPGGSITPAAGAGTDDVATSNSVGAGSISVTFPGYDKSAAVVDRPYRIEFLFGGTVFAPATLTGVL